MLRFWLIYCIFVNCVFYETPYTLHLKLGLLKLHKKTSILEWKSFWLKNKSAYKRKSKYLPRKSEHIPFVNMHVRVIARPKRQSVKDINVWVGASALYSWPWGQSDLPTRTSRVAHHIRPVTHTHKYKVYVIRKHNYFN